MRYKKGFMLIEAVMGMVLVTGSLAFLKTQSENSDRRDEARNFGTEIGGLVAAVDRRILLDGLYNPNGWDNDWYGVRSVKRDALVAELIAADNSQDKPCCD